MIYKPDCIDLIDNRTDDIDNGSNIFFPLNEIVFKEDRVLLPPTVFVSNTSELVFSDATNIDTSVLDTIDGCTIKTLGHSPIEAVFNDKNLYHITSSENTNGIWPATQNSRHVYEFRNQVVHSPT